MEETVYLNGILVPKSTAKVSAMDYGFLYGYGLFETMRAYNGTIFRFNSHLARIAKSADRLGIAIDAVALKKAVVDTLKVNGLRDARIRMTVSIGEGSPVPDPSSCIHPTILIVATEYTPYANATYQKGFRVITSSIRLNSQSPVPALKTTNYLGSLLARQEAKAAGADDALFLNDKGQLAESSTCNIFLISKKTIKTPTSKSGILPGITRGIILELALQMGINTSETDIQPEELLEADEAFLTNSLIGIMPVTDFNGEAISDRQPGITTRQLMEAYKNLILTETHHGLCPDE